MVQCCRPVQVCATNSRSQALDPRIVSMISLFVYNVEGLRIGVLALSNIGVASILVLPPD